MEGDDERRAFLDITEFTGSLVIVKTKEREQIVAWDPMEADITEAVRSGEDILVTYVSTRRNTFGPLHLVPKYHGMYGPNHFVTEGDAFSENYELIESGIEKLMVKVR